MKKRLPVYALFHNGQQLGPQCGTWWAALCEANARGLVVMASQCNFTLAPFTEIVVVDTTKTDLRSDHHLLTPL